MKRKQIAERWGAEQLEKMTGTPWRMRERDEQPRRPVDIRPRRNIEVQVPRPRAEEWIPKRTYLRKHVEFAKYGFTEQCPGCESAQAGTKSRAHNEECRKRVERMMEEDSAHQRRLVDTKKRKERHYEETDKEKGRKKKRKKQETPKPKEAGRSKEKSQQKKKSQTRNARKNNTRMSTPTWSTGTTLKRT